MTRVIDWLYGLLALILLLCVVLTMGCSMMQMPKPPEMSAQDYMKTLELNNAAGCAVVTFRGSATPFADVVAKVATINVFGKTPPDLAQCLGALPMGLEGRTPSATVPRAQVTQDSPADRLIRMIEGMR